MPSESIGTKKNKEELDELLNSFGTLEQDLLKQYPNDTVIEHIHKLADRLVKEIEDTKGRASGRLQQSIIDADSIKREATNFVAKYTLTMLDYYEDYDQGSKPKSVPLNDLIKWAQFKGLATEWSKEKDERAKATQNVQLKIATATQASIAKNGTIARFKYKGSGFFTRLVTEDKEGFIARIEKEVENTIGVLFKLNLTKKAKK